MHALTPPHHLAAPQIREHLAGVLAGAAAEEVPRRLAAATRTSLDELGAALRELAEAKQLPLEQARAGRGTAGKEAARGRLC